MNKWWWIVAKNQSGCMVVWTFHVSCAWIWCAYQRLNILSNTLVDDYNEWVIPVFDTVFWLIAVNDCGEEMLIIMMKYIVATYSTWLLMAMIDDDNDTNNHTCQFIHWFWDCFVEWAYDSATIFSDQLTLVAKNDSFEGCCPSWSEMTTVFNASKWLISWLSLLTLSRWHGWGCKKWWVTLW